MSFSESGFVYMGRTKKCVILESPVGAAPVNKNANANTFDGNRMTYYTNTLYSVGDTIKLYNSSK